MDNQTAINILKALKRQARQKEVYEALELACKSLAITDGITVTDSVPPVQEIAPV
jgi:hypothetical protein